MIRVRHVAEGSPWPGGYSGDLCRPIPAGGEAELPEHVAEYLFREFPEHFAVVLSGGGMSGGPSPEILPADVIPSAPEPVEPEAPKKRRG